MKIGLNLAAKLLENNLREAIKGSGCPAVIVCGVLRTITEEQRTRMEQAVVEEAAAFKESTQAPAPAPMPLPEKEEGSEDNDREADHTDHAGH